MAIVKEKPLTFVNIEPNNLKLYVATEPNNVIRLDVHNLRGSLMKYSKIVAHHQPLSRRWSRFSGIWGGGNLQFGAMPTYDYTWFLKRPKDNPDCLQVSNEIANSSIGPSVLKCYVYAISLAMKDPHSPDPKSSKSINWNEYNPRPSDDDNDQSFNGDDGSSNDHINKNQNQKTSKGGTNYNIIRKGGVLEAGTKRASLELLGGVTMR
jgi:hypothetical protein